MRIKIIEVQIVNFRVNCDITVV